MYPMTTLRSISLTIFLVFTNFGPKVFAQNSTQNLNCTPIKCGQSSRFRLNEKGTESLIQLGFDTVTQNLDLLEEANSALEKQEWPHTFNIGKGEEAIKASVDNLEFNALKFGNSDVDIDKDKINVCVPIDEMDIELDASLDINGTTLNQKGARAFIAPEAKEKPKVCFNGRVDESGQIGELVHIENEIPSDITAETKKALLNFDIEKANQDELLFTYMTLYFMEDNMEFPLNFDQFSWQSWSDAGSFLRDAGPETLKRFIDFNKMKQQLSSIKGSQVSTPESPQNEGLIGYMGAMQVDLNLEQNPTQLPNRGIFEEAYSIWQEEAPANVRPKDDSYWGLWSMMQSAGDVVVDTYNKSINSVAAVARGINNQVAFKTEDIIRNRFLPYMQETFNNSVTASAPVMTTIAKTAEKKLIPLAKKKANEAIKAFQEATSFNQVMTTNLRRPVFNAQDFVDSDSLSRIQENFSDPRLVNVLENSSNLSSRREIDPYLESFENLLQELEVYERSISSESSDRNVGDFLKDNLLPFMETFNHNLNSRTGGQVPMALRERARRAQQKLAAKQSLIDTNYNRRNREVELQLTTNWFNEVSGGPELTVAVPELCAEGVGELQESTVITEADRNQYDLSAAVSTDAINAVVRQSFNQGNFDFCLFDNQVKTCSTTPGNFDNRCRFQKSPELVWNSEKKKHQIHLKNLQCDSRLLNAGKRCGQRDQPNNVPVLSFVVNAVARVGGALCEFAVDQGDDFLTGSVGQNLIDVTVDIEPQVCGQSICLNPTLTDSKVLNDIENVNPSLANIVGKAIALVTSPVSDIVKKEIVDDSLMEFVEDKIASPLSSPIGVIPKRIVSEEGRITVLSDIEPQGSLGQFARECLARNQSCNENAFLKIDGKPIPLSN